MRTRLSQCVRQVGPIHGPKHHSQTAELPWYICMQALSGYKHTDRDTQREKNPTLQPVRSSAYVFEGHRNVFPLYRRKVVLAPEHQCSRQVDLSLAAASFNPSIHVSVCLKYGDSFLLVYEHVYHHLLCIFVEVALNDHPCGKPVPKWMRICLPCTLW
jgi:hypothetical protein